MADAPLPGWAVGVWRRTTLARGGGPDVADGEVWWLQAGGDGAFADVRTGGTEVRAFAGVTTADGDALTWHHAVDHPAAPVGPGPLVDTGRVLRTRDPDGAPVLVETGAWDVGGRTETYRERWRRVADGPTRTHTAGDARLVVVDGHAAAVGARGARRWERVGAAWVVRATVGDPPPLTP